MNYRFLPQAECDLSDAVDYYEIIYAIEDDTVLILAVANQHRHPDFWKNR